MLSPNQQLTVFFAGMIITNVFIALVTALISRRLAVMETKLGGPVKPLWRHVLAELGVGLTHDWGEELDTLMTQADLEPEVPMSVKDDERLNVLLEQRANNLAVPLAERAKARMYKDALLLVRHEGQNPATLRDIRLVGNQPGQEQNLDDK